MMIKKQALIAAIALAGVYAPAMAQGPLQQLRQVAVASQAAATASSLEQASLTSSTPVDGSQSAVLGDLGVSAGQGNKPTPILSSAQENTSPTPPPPAEQAPPKEPMTLDTWDKVSLGITLGGGIALPLVLAACGVVAAPTAGLIAIALIIAGVLMGGLFKPKPKQST